METDVDCLFDDPVLVLVFIGEDISVSELLNRRFATADLLDFRRQIVPLVFS